MNNVFRNERHDVNRSVAFLPVGSLQHYMKYHKLEKPPTHGTRKLNEKGELVGWDTTFLDEIRNAEERRGCWMGRTDIVLINEDDHQFMVYPQPNGELGGNVDKLTPEDKE